MQTLRKRTPSVQVKLSYLIVPFLTSGEYDNWLPSLRMFLHLEMLEPILQAESKSMSTISLQLGFRAIDTSLNPGIM